MVGSHAIHNNVYLGRSPRRLGAVVEPVARRREVRLVYSCHVLFVVGVGRIPHFYAAQAK